MRKGLQNDDLRLFATNFIENHIDFNHVPNDSPLGDIKHFRETNFHPVHLRLRSMPSVAKSLWEDLY